MIWYHGSPDILKVLRAGSTITQNRELARIFSHKPPVVVMEDGSHILHTGTQPGYLYHIDGPVVSTDILEHPYSSMGSGLEWLTLRDLALTLKENTTPKLQERLTDEKLAELLQQQEKPKKDNAPVPAILYGTRNQAKVTYMRETLRGIPLRLTDLCDPDCPVTEAEENGQHPMENAEEKAFHYWRQLRQPVFSIDSGLYFRGVAPEDQPGVLIRRMNGHRMDDEEMIAHYSGLARKYGGRLEAYYHNAICLVLDDKHALRYDGEDLNSNTFHIVSQPHERRHSGLPLDSLSVEIRSGAYYFDLPYTSKQKKGQEQEPLADLALIDGFAGLFWRILPLLRSRCPVTPDDSLRSH